MSGDYAGIYLGMDADTSGTGVAKGAEVIETLKDMIDVIEDVIKICSGITVKVEGEETQPLETLKPLAKRCKLIAEYLPDIESKTVITSFD